MRRCRNNTLSRTGLLGGILSFFGLTALLTAASITNLSPVIGHPGDVYHIIGTGFNPAPPNNIVLFGLNRAPVRAAIATRLTVQVSNGQPLGITAVSLKWRPSRLLSLYSARFWPAWFMPR